MVSKAPQRHEISTDEQRRLRLDFTRELYQGDTLTGSPIVSAASAISITGAAINGSAVSILGRSVAAGKAVTFLVSAATAGKYTIEVQCATDQGETIEGLVDLYVSESRF